MEHTLSNFGFESDGHYHKPHLNYLQNKISNNYFKFSFTRNPFDKLVSEYKWFSDQKNPWNGIACKKHYLNTSFNTFLKKFISNHIGDPWHTKSQYDMLKPLDQMDFIGRFENIQKDFDKVCKKIGIPQHKLPHKNKRKHKHYTDYYDDETRQIVADKYAEDIEHFGYKFGE